MTASWSGSKRAYRIQVRGARSAPNGELPSDYTQTGTARRRSYQEEAAILRVILPPRAQPSRRCETQAPLSGKPPSCAKCFGPLTASPRSGNLIAADGTKNGPFPVGWRIRSKAISTEPREMHKPRRRFVRQGLPNTTKIAASGRETPSALSYTIIGARLGYRGLPSRCDGQFIGFMGVESRARRQAKGRYFSGTPALRSPTK